MSKYSKNELKVAAAQERRIGGYQGKSVYACSKWAYEKLNNTQKKDRYYVIYDDGNKLVNDYQVVGSINERGEVSEFRGRFIPPQVDYMKPAPTPEKPKAPQKTVPATEYSAMVNGGEGPVSADNFFANLDREINELLATQFKVEDMPWA